ncbi:MAG: type I-C CRISPR-associated protein Cas8c/Csd1 [Eubacteriales bacterium]|nr:type I-C CRISPR-associated protein Cas8c/Csd1 [Eubacteriales bacterium]
MIIQSLVTYYEALIKKDSDISPPGYSVAPVAFGLILRENGTLKEIKSLALEIPEKKGKFTNPRVKVPQQEIRASGVKSNFLCDNSAYILGIDNKGKPERTLQCFEAAKLLHKNILGNSDIPAAKMICAFYDKWLPENAAENEVIIPYLKEIYTGVNIAFMDEDFSFVHDNPAVRDIWRQRYESGDGDVQRRCLITGKTAPAAILHEKIKGVRGAQGVGANLVSFNANAYESYGCEGSQGLNAPVSKYASFAYSTVLNMMLNKKNRTQLLGDTTVLWWSEEADADAEDIYATIQFGGFEDDEQKLNNLMNRLITGKPVADDNININGKFCILGLAPNAARLSVRFFYRDSFGAILEHNAAHYRRLEITKPDFARRYLTPYWLLNETTPPQMRERTPSPLLAGAVMRSIIGDLPYPAALYNAIIIRIRAERHISSDKAAIIKAYLLKNSNNTKIKEGLTVALNEENRNSSYVLGRLFAVLEKAQKEANPNINTTIKDKYFTSACATPAVVFPHLVKQSVYNTSKSTYGKQNNYKIGTLINMLDSSALPKRLTLEEQGLFILGYYHEAQSHFGKTRANNDTNNDTNNDAEKTEKTNESGEK